MGLTADAKTFFGMQLELGDFDTVHPMLQTLVRVNGLDKEDATWLCALYMTYYNEATSWLVFTSTDRWEVPELDIQPERQRRSLYGRVAEHIESWDDKVEVYGSAKKFLTKDFTGDPTLDWDILCVTIQEVFGNGRWAAYSLADLLQKVAHYPVWPMNIANQNSTGPLKGLRRLMGEANDDTARALYQELRATDPSVMFWPHFDYAVMESLLCDWDQLNRGVFYNGRSIDRIMERIRKIEPYGDVSTLWDVRAMVWPKEVLGEYGGWFGIDKTRLSHYARTGELLWAYQSR